MSIFLFDLKQAFRSLRNAPRFTFAALTTLSLGIGATTALFSVIHGVLLRPLPYRDPSRLTAVFETEITTGQEGSLSGPNFRDFRESARSFEAIAIQRFRGFEFRGAGRPERIRGLETSAGYLEVMGYRPAKGRFFTREDEEGSPVAILSHGLWTRVFGGDPAIVGRSIVLDGRDRTIVGVAPAEVQLPRGFPAQIFVPLDWRGHPAIDRGDHTYRGIGRLRPGASVTAATVELKALTHALADRFPSEVRRDWPSVALDLRTYLLGNRMRPLLLLMGAVSLLLLIACTNVANLFLARTLGRSRDTAIRISLGSGVRDLFGTLFAEGLIVSLAGGLLGLALSLVAIRSVPLWLPGAAELTGIQQLQMNPSVAAFAFLLVLGTSFFFALTPLVQTRKLDLQSELKAGGPSASADKGSFHAWLVAGQVAMTTMLLVASGLFLRSLMKVMDTRPGFEIMDLVTFNLRLPSGRYASEERLRSFQSELVQRLQGLPGVESVGTTCEAPLTGEDSDTNFQVGDQVRTVPPAQWPSAERDQVGGRFFETMKIPIRAGRALNERDAVDSPRVVVVSESLARRYIQGDPIGQRLVHGQISEASPPWTSFEIVGVAADIRNSSQEKPPAPRIYMPFAQVPRSYLSALLRTRQSPQALRGLLEAVVSELDPQLPVERIYSMEEQARESAADRRQSILLLGAFTILALFLSGVGIYSVVSYLVAQRRKEFGIRVALGAQVAEVVAMVLGRGFRTALTGVAIGLVAAAAGGRVLSSYLYGVTSFDPVAVTASILTLLATSLLACLVPALRAASVDPVVALREP